MSFSATLRELQNAVGTAVAGPRLADPAAGADCGPRRRHRLAARATHLAAAGASCARRRRSTSSCPAACRSGPQGHRRPGDRHCAPVRDAAGRTGCPGRCAADADEPGPVGGLRSERSHQGPGDHRRVARRQRRSTRSAPRCVRERNCMPSTWIASFWIATASSKRCRCRNRTLRASPSRVRRPHRGRAAVNSRTTCGGSPRRIRARSPRSCARSRCSRTACSAAIASTPAAIGSSSPSSVCSPATWCCRSTARRSTIRSAAWRSSTRSALPTASQ